MNIIIIKCLNPLAILGIIADNRETTKLTLLGLIEGAL